MFAFLLFLAITMSSAWNVLLSHPFYGNVKLVTSSTPLLVFLSPGSQFDCALLCLRRSDCQSTNWYNVNGSNVCELLKSNICSDPLRTSIVPQPFSRIWDKVFDYTNNQSCISVIQTNLPVNCTGINSTVCDHCTRTCGDCFQRLKNNSATNQQYPCTLWPQGIVNSSLTMFCMSRTPYLIMRKYLNFGVPDTNYSQNMSVTDMHRVVRLGIYKTIHFRIVLKNNTQPRGVYRFDGEGIDEQGRLSVTFLPSAYPLNNTDVLNLKGQPLIKAPFVNTSEVLPSCGPFWLLPQGNSTCPGGNVIRFGTKPKYLSNGTIIDIGVHWSSAGNTIDFNRACISLA